MSQAIVDAATAPIQAYNAKNWDEVARSIASDAVYDEVANRRTARGTSDVITMWKGWAEAMPDSSGTIESALVSGNTVILELTWRGTHTGPLHTPGGDLPATGNKMGGRTVRHFAFNTASTRCSSACGPHITHMPER